MVVKLKWPWLGIAIPCFLISFIGYNAHYFVLRRATTFGQQVWFQCSLTMIWISYWLAFKTNPGKPPANIDSLGLKCGKCHNIKPERTHHCQTCGQCVLMMDHHCPWTQNCVGYANFPHFMRFLFWVIATTSWLGWQLAKRIYLVWIRRHWPEYMFPKYEIVWLTILMPMNIFVLFTIAMLFARCFVNQILNGRSQIESWEQDRIDALFESGRLVPRLLQNLKIQFPQYRPRASEIQNLLESYRRRRLSLDSIVNFPYDISMYQNAVNMLGIPWLWLWPWSKPAGDGITFAKNEMSHFELNLSLPDALMALSWPPDGGRNFTAAEDNRESTVEIGSIDGEQVIRQRMGSPLETRSKQDCSEIYDREKWQNAWGEKLEDFGVDVEADN